MASWTLIKSIEELIEDTEDYEDAMKYIDEVAKDCGVTRDEAIEELKKQMKVS